MIEIFAARNVTSPFLKRSDRPAGIKSKDCKGASRVGCIHLLAIEFPCGCWNFQGSRHFEVTYHPQRSKNLFFLFFWQKFSQPFYLLFTKEKATKLFRKKVFSNKVNKLGRCDNLVVGPDFWGSFRGKRSSLVTPFICMFLFTSRWAVLLRVPLFQSPTALSPSIIYSGPCVRMVQRAYLGIVCGSGIICGPVKIYCHRL